MKLHRTTRLASAGLMAIMLTAFGVVTSIAQPTALGQIGARALTPQEIKDHGLPATTQTSGGLHTVGLGQPAVRGFWWRAQLRAVAEQDRIATKFSNGTENRSVGFVTADAEFGWRFGKIVAFESAGLAVQLSNLADKRYHEHQTEGVSGNELAAPGRGVALSLNGSF